MRRLLLYILILSQVTLLGQTYELEFKNYEILKSEELNLIGFENAVYSDNLHPFLIKSLNGNFSSAKHSSFTYTNCSKEELDIIQNDQIPDSPEIILTIGKSSGQWQSTIKINPFVRLSGEVVKIKTIKIELTRNRTPDSSSERSSWAENSVLKNGTWFKFKIPQKGIYEITYQELIDLGIISAPIPSESLGIYSNPSEMLSYFVGETVMDDLVELPTKLKINDTGLFGPGNSISFYAEANGKIKYDEDKGVWKNEVNLYSDTNYVFLSIDTDSRKVLTEDLSIAPIEFMYDYTRIIHHEKEWLNFIKSGRNWYGEKFEDSKLEYSHSYNKPKSKPVAFTLNYNLCARSEVSTDNVISVSINSDTVSDASISKVSEEYYNNYVNFGSKTVNLFYIGEEDSYDLKFEYHQKDNPLAWIDYYTINSNERIVSLNSQFYFKILDNTKANTEVNVLSSASNFEVWDVTDLKNVFTVKSTKNDSGCTFTSNLDTIRDFIVVEDQTYLKPIFDSKITNQNLHAAKASNYIVLTTKNFESQAKEIIQLHEEHDNLSGQFYFVDEIFNEFSSGRPEAIALRNFIKSIYEKGKGTDDSLKYVLLFGDGSFDPKNRISMNVNLIPTYQSDNSIKLTRSYVTDDFFGLMDDGEGDYEAGDLLDLGIGRLPVSSTYQANNVVEKLKNYYDIYPEVSSVNDYEKSIYTSKGSWRNNILFVADDEDRNIHMRQAREIADRVDTIVSNLNQKKVFLDAFEQINTSNGVRSPGANQKLMELLDEGVLIVNFNGHGGELGWMDERIYMIEDIKEMSNKTKLPLFMTATCEFSRFDAPEHLSAGELLVLKPDGGAIALFTTVRLVFSAPNFRLNETFYKVLQQSIKDNKLALGDLFKTTKVVNDGGNNDRNFTLLGDPAMRLSLPVFKTVLDSVKLGELSTDTIKSLSSPTIYGSVLNESNEVAEDYNGWVEIQLFDKEKYIITIGTDPVGKFDYDAKEDLLFKGKAKVINGKFQTEIYVPKDARQDFDYSRFSFYALDETKGDAAGNNEKVILGGTDENASIDETGPAIELFLDDTTFVFGDNVTSSPIFIAQLFDSSGINIMPNNLGKDVTLVIDERNDLSFNLNKYYTPSESTYRKGEVIFPIDQLSEGRHSLEFKAFDNQNNSSKAYTEFIIENNPELALKHVLNYPNPFTTNTGFYFEHNQTNNELEVLIQIYTISGKMIKTLNGTFNTNNQRVGPVNWDGLDEYGDKIGRGVYVYKVTVQTSGGDSEEAVSKLVLLR